MLLGGPAGAQDGDTTTPVLSWNAPDGADNVVWPLRVDGTVSAQSRVILVLEIWNEDTLMGTRVCNICSGSSFDLSQPEFSFDTHNYAVDIEGAITLKLIATDGAGNVGTIEATFTVAAPNVTITSPADGDEDVAYPFVIRGDSEEGVRSLLLVVVFEQGPWRVAIGTRRQSDGSFVTRFDPRLLQGWTWSDEPWTVTVQTRDFYPLRLTRFSITGPSVSGYCNGYAATVDIGAGQNPTERQDIILGTAGNDVIHALGGNDVICAGAGIDRIFSGDGDDIVFGGDNRDIIETGDGDDRVYGGAGADRIKLGHGNDFALGESGADQIRAGVGSDSIHGGPGVNTLYGGSGNDILNGGNLRSTAHGDSGHDLCIRAQKVDCEVVLVRPR